MRAGRRRHRVSIMDVARTADGLGGFTEVWSEFAPAYAAVEPSTGKELAENHTLRAEVTHTVRTLYISGVRPHMRVAFGSRNLEILAVLNHDERNRDLVMLCREVAE